MQLNAEAHLQAVRERREAAALKYKPSKINLLLVAEAPPSADDRYFYFDHVTIHDWLYLGVTEILLSNNRSRSNKAMGLAELRESGVFLIDLKLDPMDGSRLQSYVPELISRCRTLNPKRIILIKATVFDAAYDALKAAELPVVNKRIYFPSTGRQGEFRHQFREALSMEIINK